MLQSVLDCKNGTSWGLFLKDVKLLCNAVTVYHGSQDFKESQLSLGITS